jgi:hypothetical protein
MKRIRTLLASVVVGLSLAPFGMIATARDRTSPSDNAPIAAGPQAALAATEYQVEYRHPTETNNEWRVSVAWTTDYTYAKGTYDYLVGLQTYDVRFYQRTR